MSDATVWDSLSPFSSQILLCDLQKQIVARSKTMQPAGLSKSAGVLLQLAKLFSLPAILSVVPEDGKAPELIPELEVGYGTVPHFLRSSANPFLDQNTRNALAKNDRKTMIIAGFATEAVVLYAVLDAVKAGYKVIVPVDACGGLSERTEQAAFRQIEAAGAVTTSVVSIAIALAPDFTTDLGKQMFALIQQIRLS